MSTLDQIVAGYHFTTHPLRSRRYKRLAPLVRCKDGTTLSVQASADHCSEPRDDVGPYTQVEVYRLSCDVPEEWGVYTVYSAYCYVPVTLVYRLVRQHGGEV